MWISPEFKIYLVKEFRRLKDEESDRLKLDWNLQSTLSKINYRGKGVDSWIQCWTKLCRCFALAGMAGKARVEYSGAVYHVLDRGDRREAIFHDEEDRNLFLATLAQACKRTGWRVHAWVLMGNSLKVNG